MQYRITIGRNNIIMINKEILGLSIRYAKRIRFSIKILWPKHTKTKLLTLALELWLYNEINDRL